MTAFRSRLAVFVSLAVLLLAAAAVPATAADICVNVDGEEVYQSGSAECYSIEGSQAVAVGSDSYADTSFPGSGNSAISVGDGATSYAGDGDSNTSTAVGDDTIADTGFGDNNTSTVVGDRNDTSIYGNSNTATVVGDDSTAFMNFDPDEAGNDNSAVLVGNWNNVTIDNGDENTVVVADNAEDVELSGVDNCIVIDVGAYEYESCW